MNTIKIGSQEWATEDLRVTHFRNGDPIPLVRDNYEWAELEIGAYCISPSGHYLYNWYAVNDPRGLGPKGFHVPSDDEWTVLENLLGGRRLAGEALKSAATDSDIWDGSNSSGFSALPCGFRESENGYFCKLCYNKGACGFSSYPIGLKDEKTDFEPNAEENLAACGFWWTSSHFDLTGFYRELHSGSSSIGRHVYSPRNGFAVRCIKTQIK